MERFILQPELIKRMGQASWRIAEGSFDARKVVSRVYERLQWLTKDLRETIRCAHRTYHLSGAASVKSRNRRITPITFTGA
jgi:hypothetical protein